MSGDSEMRSCGRRWVAADVADCRLEAGSTGLCDSSSRSCYSLTESNRDMLGAKGFLVAGEVLSWRESLKPMRALSLLCYLSKVGLGILSVMAFLVSAEAQGLQGKAWVRHVVDGTSRGADGVRLADVDGDGLPDVVTGWEEGGTVRVYRNPGAKAAKQAWPAVTVGKVPSVEDAVLVDMDGDGVMDVVSSAEGKQRSLQVHWAPKKDYWQTEGWRMEAIPTAKDKMMWMYATPTELNGKKGVEILAGGKNAGAELGWWEVSDKARELKDWQWHALRPLGWVMSIEAVDMDGDGDMDVLFTDRKGKRSGCFWLEHPGADKLNEPWKEHLIGAEGLEAMFLRQGDLDGDGLLDVAVAVRPGELKLCRRLDSTGRKWSERSVTLPPGVGGAKGIAIGDINGDGRMDLVGSCEHAEAPKSGVFWLEAPKDPWKEEWQAREISGPEGIKYDLIQLLDLDGDGDLDVLTCEERANLGVIWYENPGSGTTVKGFSNQ